MKDKLIQLILQGNAEALDVYSRLIETAAVLAVYSGSIPYTPKSQQLHAATMNQLTRKAHDLTALADEKEM
jgi:hypothetical protein